MSGVTYSDIETAGRHCRSELSQAYVCNKLVLHKLCAKQRAYCQDVLLRNAHQPGERIKQVRKDQFEGERGTAGVLNGFTCVSAISAI